MALKNTLQQMNGGWNFDKTSYVKYSPSGEHVSMIFKNADGSISSYHGEEVLSNGKDLPRTSSQYLSTKFVDGVKSATKWSAPLVVLGDGLEYGVNTYFNVDTDKNFHNPSNFIADVALDIPKAAASGAVGTVAGTSAAVFTGAGVGVLAAGFESAALGAAAGPVGVGVGFVLGFAASYVASSYF